MANKVCIVESDKIVDGTNLMKGNTDLVKWDSNLSSLVYGNYMFAETNIASFSSNLSSLVDGENMFCITNLTSFDSDLSNLVHGMEMFSGCSYLTSFNSDLNNLVDGERMFSSTPLESFSGNLSNLIYGSSMFYSTALTSFSEDLSKLTEGVEMFALCLALTSFNSDLSSLNIGVAMFLDTPLESFNSNLNNLTNGEGMFYNCNLDADSVRNIALTINNEVTDNPTLTLGVDTSILTNTQTKNDFGVIIYKGWNLMADESSSFDYTPWSSQKYSGCTSIGDIQAVDSNYLTTDIINGRWTEHLCDLENGRNMFPPVASSLTSFSGDLSSLTNGIFMFAYTSLTSFNGDLSMLVNGNSMFFGTSLTSFNGDLSSLTNGRSMFSNCELNTKSIKCIADSIKDVTELTNSSDINEGIYKEIGLDIGNTTPTAEEQAYLNTIAAKGWTVYVNGSAYTPTGVASVMTLDEDGNEMETPIPYYAKPVPSDEESATYIDAEGNYFNIVGAQFIYGDDLSTYGMFTCEEDAAFNMGLTKIDK